MSSTHTHTYAKMKVSQQTFNEIQGRLTAAGYNDQIHNDSEGPVLDMHGIALVKNDQEDAFVINPGRGASPEEIQNAARKGFKVQ